MKQKIHKKLVNLSRMLAMSGSAVLFLAIVPTVTGFTTQSSNNQPAVLAVKPEYQPAFNPELPQTNMVSIPSIGVETQIREAVIQNYEDALKEGVWRVTDFGTPEFRNSPTIIVAHRFGYLAWSNEYRRQNSFYNLPKLDVGDIVEIVWKQRKYVYEVYAESEGQEISDYSADLILYTCKLLNSDIRVFKYARLLEV